MRTQSKLGPGAGNTCSAFGAAGKIGASELAELFQNLGHPLTYERLVEIMRHYDLDHSGQIEFGEFLRMFQTELLDLQELLQYIHGDSTQLSASTHPPTVCARLHGVRFALRRGSGWEGRWGNGEERHRQIIFGK